MLDKCCIAYLDVLIYSDNITEHRQHVREVVSRLAEAGLQIDINKCKFETKRTKYLGLIVTPSGIEMDPDKVSTIRDWERTKMRQRFATIPRLRKLLPTIHPKLLPDLLTP